MKGLCKEQTELLYLHEIFHACVRDNMVRFRVDVKLRKVLVLLQHSCQLLQAFARAAFQPLLKKAFHPGVHVLPELVGGFAPWKQGTCKA